MNALVKMFEVPARTFKVVKVGNELAAATHTGAHFPRVIITQTFTENKNSRSVSKQRTKAESADKQYLLANVYTTEMKVNG